MTSGLNKIAVAFFLSLLNLNFLRGDDFSSTPTGQLISAIENNDNSLAEKLILSGVDINIQRWDGDLHTPLIAACRLGNVKIAELLIQSGARVDLKDHDGYTALKWAEQTHNKKLIALLNKIQSQ
jgi:ankyrin repeat protein